MAHLTWGHQHSNFTRAVCTVSIMKKPYRCSSLVSISFDLPFRSSPLCPTALERRILLGRNDLEALHYNTVTDTGKLHPRRVSSAFDQLVVGLLLPEDLGWWRSAARHQADPGVGLLELVKLPCANLPGRPKSWNRPETPSIGSSPTPPRPIPMLKPCSFDYFSLNFMINFPPWCSTSCLLCWRVWRF